MAFWGIELKPGKPVTHSFDKVQRRLRISQATLGIGSATKTSFVQCNVGNKYPVFLCALLPNKTESCHLDLEFEEPDDVVFSVLGPRSIFLTGYYVSNRSNANFTSDTESYGEDIADTETEQSGLQSDGDKYEDSFIDDDDPVVSPSSPPSPPSCARDDEKLQHTKKMKEKNDAHNPPRRRFQVIDSDDDASSQENGEDGKFDFQFFKNKKAATASMSEGEKIEPECQGTLKADDKIPDSANSGSSKEIADGVIKHREPESAPGLVNNKKLKRKRKEEGDELKSLEGTIGNHRKARKEVKAQQGDADADGRLHGLPSEQNQKPISNGNLMHSAEMNSRHGPSTKKGAKVGDMEQTPMDHNDGARNKIGVDHHVPEEAGKINQIVQEFDDKKATAERDANSDLVADGCNLQKAKKKKKKIKSHADDETLNTGRTLLADKASGRSSKKVDVWNCEGTSSSQVRTLSNGLTVEDLSHGDKDGKVAALGKKVKVFYTVLLKENGQVLDSNFGRSPYKFRLGDEDVIEGWNVGLEGMHVGDKRRLTVPPSMGYGSQGAAENIPPNSWLVYDVQLVSAR